MKPAFRSTALAVVVTMLSLGASAAVTVPITFEDIGAAAASAKEPVAFGGSDGLDFSGAWGYQWDMLTADDFLPEEFDAGDCLNPLGCNKTGFIMNRSRLADTGPVTLMLNDTLKGQYIQAISFDLFTSASRDGMRAYAYDASGNVQEFDNFTDGNKLWTNWSTPVTLAEVNRIVIEFGDFGGSAFGMDNLNITLSDASTGGGGTGGGGTGGGGTGGGGTGGGTVPEPASFALVGLALLAAGAARRRKA